MFTKWSICCWLTLVIYLRSPAALPTSRLLAEPMTIQYIIIICGQEYEMDVAVFVEGESATAAADVGERRNKTLTDNNDEVTRLRLNNIILRYIIMNKKTAMPKDLTK